MTSETSEKATAGPWWFVAGNIYSDKDGAKHRRICAIAFYGDEDKEAEANAKLIAAAPAAVTQLAALVKHVEALNHAFYVEGTAKALKVAFTGQRELLRSARELLASLEGAL